ncbi:MAG: hypothetical protein RLY31_1458 [Bacteroidota bacterium]|jgi:AraC-like DNA-binding protein
MERTHRFDTISEYNAFNNHETPHPLVSVLDFAKAHPRRGYRMEFGIYLVVLKAVKCGDMRYGRHHYDYQEGTLVFFSPGQVMQVEDDGSAYQPMGHGLAFHPDLLHGTSLDAAIHSYKFFSYHTNEALHLSEQEKQVVLDCFTRIQAELRQSVDKHSKKLIAANIELFLNYCERFYDRQFLTRDQANQGIMEKLEELLANYFSSDKPRTTGLPSVAYCARELNLSANYFGDLVKKETGRTAQEYLQQKLLDEAKDRLRHPAISVGEVAFGLGFRYPQHFSRLFKQRTGCTPVEYRSLHAN